MTEWWRRPPRPELLEFRYTRLVRIRWLMSSGTLVSLLGMTTSYLFRGSMTSLGRPIGGIVGMIDDVGPVWDVTFGASLVLLVWALVTRRFLAGAHVLAAAVIAGYATALAYEVVLVPTAGWATSSTTVGLSLWTFVLALIYAKGR